MAYFKPCLVNKALLDTFPIQAGQLIICPDSGEIYVDISNIWRRQCLSNIQGISVNGVLQEIDASGNVDIQLPILHKSTASWDADPSFVPAAGQIIIYDDAGIINDVTCANIKLGNGITSVVNLPFITDPLKDLITQHINDTTKHITSDERDDWNSKVSCRVSEEDNLIIFE